jgi:hypothetical protein
MPSSIHAECVTVESRYRTETYHASSRLGQIVARPQARDPMHGYDFATDIRPVSRAGLYKALDLHACPGIVLDVWYAATPSGRPVDFVTVRTLFWAVLARYRKDRKMRLNLTKLLGNHFSVHSSIGGTHAGERPRGRKPRVRDILGDEPLDDAPDPGYDPDDLTGDD